MKTENFNLLFYLKKVNGYESGNLPIYLRIFVDGKRSEATIGRGIEPEKWDEKRGKARGNTEDARILNAHFGSIVVKLKRIHTRLLDSEEEIPADTLRNELAGKGKKSKMLLEIFSDHNKQMESLIGSISADIRIMPPPRPTMPPVKPAARPIKIRTLNVDPLIMI